MMPCQPGCEAQGITAHTLPVAMVKAHVGVLLPNIHTELPTEGKPPGEPPGSSTAQGDPKGVKGHEESSAPTPQIPGAEPLKQQQLKRQFGSCKAKGLQSCTPVRIHPEVPYVTPTESC